MSERRVHRMPFGAEWLDGRARFRLWAPARRNVTLLLPDRSLELPMKALDDGWFELETGEPSAGSPYGFRLDEGTCVPDPAARAQASDVHGPSIVVDPARFEWRHDAQARPAWHEAVIYELHVGAFSDAGTFDGVRAKLDHLANLGVTAVELMPVADFPGDRNWGYDGVLPFAPDHCYGAPEDLKRLVDQAHERSIAVILDVVYNHFGPGGNYLHLYAPQFFDERIHTPWGAGIDFMQREVREFFIHNALYWLEEYGFDGLRLDAVHAIHDGSTPNFLEELAARVRDAHGNRAWLILENDDNAARYLDGSAGNALRAYAGLRARVAANGDCASVGRDKRSVPGVSDPGRREDDAACVSSDITAGRHERSVAGKYTAQWNDDFHHVAHVLLTGEQQGYYADYTKEPLHRLARALTQGFVYQGERSPFRDGAPRGEPSSHLPPGAFVHFLQNHDQIGNRAFGERLTTLAEARALRAMLVVLLLSPQPPLLFMGEEWGSKQPYFYFCDHAGELAAAVREGRRDEFEKFPQFSDPNAREAIPDPNAETTFTLSRLDWAALDTPDGREWFELVRSLLRVRREAVAHAELAGEAGRARHRIWNGNGLEVTWSAGDSSLILQANLSGKPAADRPDAPGDLLFEWPPGAGSGDAMPAWSAAWYRAPIALRRASA